MSIFSNFRKGSIFSNHNKTTEPETEESINKRLEDTFTNNEESIFKNIVLPCIFGENNKYSDEGIFSKCESKFKEYFENLGFNWNDRKALVFQLFQKSKTIKLLAVKLEENYEYYINNRIIFNWEGHFSDWLKIVIDKSINDKKALTKQYARMIIGNYYYKDFSNKGKIDALYKNLIAMISSEEFKTWIINDSSCFDILIQKIKKRFIKIKVDIVDDRELIIQIVKSKLFQQALKEFDFIDSYARQSIYSSIYIKAISETITNTTNLNIKNIYNNEAEIKKDNNPQSFEKKEIINESSIKNDTINNLSENEIKERINARKQNIIQENKYNSQAQSILDNFVTKSKDVIDRSASELNKVEKSIDKNLINNTSYSSIDNLSEKEILEKIKDTKVDENKKIVQNNFNKLKLQKISQIAQLIKDISIKQNEKILVKKDLNVSNKKQSDILIEKELKPTLNSNSSNETKIITKPIKEEKNISTSTNDINKTASNQKAKNNINTITDLDEFFKKIGSNVKNNKSTFDIFFETIIEELKDLEFLDDNSIDDTYYLKQNLDDTIDDLYYF